MSSTKTKRTMPLGPLLETAIKKKGLALPETEEEIAATEKELQSTPVEYPARLLVAPNFRAGGEQKFRLRGRAVVDEAMVEELGRAARGGAAIPKEVEEQMARDREAAARRGEGDDEKK